MLAACLLPGCVNYTSDLCIPHVDTFCHQGQTYWLDSCDRLENVLEECECGCRADQYGCRSCGEKECETNNDCPEDYYCVRTDWYCKPIECIPDCTGKCCGTDGCGGTCPDNCPRGELCNPSTCRCESELECQSNSDCPQGYWCDRTVWRCRPIECIPNCTGKCCGDDGCAGTCPNNCPTGYECNMRSCACVPTGCQTDADCLATQCCINRTCVPMACGALECGPDPVCGKECGPCPQGETCNNGVCRYVDEFLCPLGQECVQVGAEGLLGCIIPPATVPPENQTGCAQTYCDGNFSCHCMDATCSQSVCIENCGTCPAGTECCLITAGIWGCLTPGCTDIPPNPPYCDQNNRCYGNAGCFTDATNNFCINFCSEGHGP